VLVTALALVLVGAIAGRNRLREADLVTGWGLFTAAATLYGTLTTLPLTWLVYPLSLATVFGFTVWHRERWRSVPDWTRIAVIGLPLLLITSAMQPSQWDEFSQWLWSARYLLDIDRFPAVGLPPSVESFPAYPKAMAFAIYLPSRMAGFYVENSGALFNILVLLSVALLVARMASLGAGTAAGSFTWPGLAGAFLATLVFPPFVVPKITLTAYAEVGTAASVAFAAVAAWRAILALAEGRDGEARALAFQMGLAATVLVSLKQANLVLFVMVMLGVVVAGLRTPGVSLGRLAALLAGSAALPVAVYVAWRLHVAGDPSAVEKTIRPFAEWEFHIIPQMLATVVGIILRKSVYFLAMFIVAGLAVRALLRYRGPGDGLFIITATVFGGYNAFLLFSYFASFGGHEGAHAASYWRYNMHVGALGVATWAYLGAELWAKRRPFLVSKAAGGGAIALALLLPLATAQNLRFDIRAPKIYTRDVGAEIIQLVPQGAKIAVVDPMDTIFFAKVLRYVVYPTADVVTAIAYQQPANLVSAELTRSGATHAWIHTQDEAVRQVFGAELPDGSSYLMEKTVQGWKEVKSWPYPGYRLPTDIPD
jgi:hypothetical protein